MILSIHAGACGPLRIRRSAQRPRNLVGCATARSVPYSLRRFSGPETWPCLPCFEERLRSGVRQVVALPSKYRSRPAVSLCGPDGS